MKHECYTKKPIDSTNSFYLQSFESVDVAEIEIPNTQIKGLIS